MAMMEVELQATCSALGYQEGKLYVKEPDCLETVKDLIRFLKREDETCDIRRQLGHAAIVQNDLLPILRQYNDEVALFETVIRLLVNLTQPAVLCFNGSVPEDKTTRNYFLEVESHLQAIKEAFISEETFAVLTDKLGDLLKLDWEHRQEEHRLLIERILILIRNILHIPPDPEAEQRTDDDASIHDQVLWAMHVSGLEDVLLYIASSEEERNLSMHILEIISLMFREQTAEILASAGAHRSVTEKEKDEKELEMVREQERLQKKAAIMKHSTRHSRFGGTFVVKNFKSISERDLICHKAQADASHIDLDTNKKPKKKPKNRKPIMDREVVRRSTLSIRLSLKEFCVQFLENCYNPLMYAVKDVLNREKSQEHDETYYLWAIRFFMEFCRHHSGQVDLVSETMSVQSFHYIQVQLFQYYEMQTMEKKEAIVWGKRVHLALKAYQELLLTLDAMDKSNNNTLMESSKVIKSNIFYVMEFRDIFITLLRHFNQSHQSRTYLKDLVETSHLFLKMLEHFSKKTGHLIVQKKKKGGRKKKPQKPAQPQGPVELSDQELEDLWDEVSGELSAIFQGRSEIPTDIQPFDAASEVEVEEQRNEAMVRIQDCLRGRKAGEAVGLFRAAREVWPERNEFGTPDIAPEDEFMALREIFMTNLPRPSPDIPFVPDEMEEEGEVEEEMEHQQFQMAEQEFVFRDFFIKFAKPEIMKPYVLLLADFDKNSTQTNHCCVKMLHRVAVDLGYIGMLFQISLFRVFQKILLSPLAKAERYKELSKFSTFVVRRFVEVAQNNSKVFMELLFWKTNKEALEVVEGYGSYQSNAKVLWSEDAEQEVHRLFTEYRENEEDGKDTVDHIMERITDLSKSRGQIIRELKRQELITSAKELKKTKGGSSRAGPWREEDELELTELYQRFKDADDPVGSIQSEMCKPRSRAKIMEKLLGLGLAEDRKALYKKRGGKSGGGGRTRRRRGSGSDDDDDDQGLQELPSDFEDDVGSGHSDNDGDAPGSGSSSSSDADGDKSERGEDAGSNGPSSMTDVITGIVDKGYKDQMAWIQRLLRRTAEDREEEDSFVPVPIVPLVEENETAMEDQVFTSFLFNIGLTPPATEQECFWRIPPQLSPLDLYNIIAGLFLDENNKPIHADKIQMKQREPKKKEKKKKTKKNRKTDERKAPKKNANKFAALKELVKKKAESKTTKRNRQKPAPADQDVTASLQLDSQSDQEAGTQTPGKSSGPGSQERNSSSKKRRRVKKVVASDSDDSDEDIPLTGFKAGPQPGSESESEAGNQSQETVSPSAGKRRRVAKMVASDSDSDEDLPLTAFKAGPQPGTESESEAGNQSQETVSPSAGKRRRVAKMVASDSDSDEDVPLTALKSKSQSEIAADKPDDAQSVDESGVDSQSQGRDSDNEDQSQSQDSAPLLFLSSSDESDQENETKQSPGRQKSTKSEDEADKGSTQSSKRSRSTDSDPEAEGRQPKKKLRVVDSDSEEDRPLSSVAEETFPATLYTQGPESDSDMDDHVPLRKVIQKKNVIESDED